MQRLAAWLGEHLDGRQVDLVRRALGLVFALTAVRTLAYGWVEALYLAPRYHFAWFPWAVVPPAPLLYGLFALMVVAGLGLALGRHPRAWSATFLVPFVYVELLDATLYLNHYVLLSLVAAAFALIPGGPTVPRWGVLWLQLLFGTVYLWAGLCKLEPDWLLRGEPLHTWLRAYASTPRVGPLLAAPATALLMSWGGAAYDLSVPFLVAWRRTRVLGLLLVVGFHVTVWALFPIGVFPWIMIPGAWLFTLPSLGPGTPAPPLRPTGLLVFTLSALALILVPGRSLLTPGDVRWHEQGYRFAWRVMLIEKTGMVDYTVTERGTGRVWRIRPSDELTDWQHEQMRTQPDLIRQYADHLADRFRAEGHDVDVAIEAWANLNGTGTRPLPVP